MNSFSKVTGDSFSGDFNYHFEDFFPEDLIISEAISPGVDDFLIPIDEDWYNTYDNKFDHCFRENFREYVEKKKLQYLDIQQDGLLLYRIFWTSGDEQHNQGCSDWGRIINKITNLCNKDIIPHSCLIQLWRSVKIDCKVFLTTENQPFIISATERGNICEEHCSYQMAMSSKNYDIFCEKEEAGFILRAFREQLINEKSHFLMESKNMTESRLLGVIEIRLDKALDGNLCSDDMTKFFAHLQEGSLEYSSWSENICEQVKSLAYIVGVRDDATPFIATNDDLYLHACYRSFEECINNSLTLPHAMLEKQHLVPETKTKKIIVTFSDTNARVPIENFSENPRINDGMDTNSVGLLQTTHGDGRLTISKLDLEKQFGKSLNEAAIAMGVSRSTVKRYREKYGYKKWPRQRRNRVTVDTNSVGLLQTTHGDGKLTISKLDLEKQFGKSLNEAAIALGVSRSTVKRYREKHGYKKWPRQRRNRVTVKAKYGNNKYLEFKLYESSGINELHEQVAKRLKESFTVHYPNLEGELILIACDDDLQTHISSSKTIGNEYFNILLVHSDD